MRRAVRVLPSGSWRPSDAVAAVTLAHDDRHRRRISLTDDAGVPFLLDLPEAARLADGDGLALDDGGVLRVVAAAEDVADVRCDDPRDLIRVAWHLGNRHLPVQLLDGTGVTVLRIQWDHVIAAMLVGLGAKVERRRAPFQPEGGAYAHGHRHAHGHGHDDDRHH